MKNAETITQNWIRENGMQVSTFNTTPVKLLQAQQQATNLLRNHANLLTQAQVQTLQNFQKRMTHKNTIIRSRAADYCKVCIHVSFVSFC